MLYCDTDSVFTSQPGDWIPPLGEYLGDLTDELNDGNVCYLPEEDYITEFVSGVRNVMHITARGKTMVECKVVTLNSNTVAVTHKSFVGLVQAFVANQNTDAHEITVSETIRQDKKALPPQE